MVGPGIGEGAMINREPLILRLFETYPMFDLYKTCIEQGGVARAVNTPFQEIILTEKATTVIQSMYPALRDSLKKQLKIVNTINLPHKFNVEKENKEAINTSLHILHSLKINPSTLSNLSLLASASNTFDEQGGGYFDMRSYRRIIERGGTLIPLIERIRDKHIRIGIGRGRVRTNATFALAIAEMQDLPMSTEDALRLGTVITSAHELGHALEYAADAQNFKKGKDKLQDKAKKLLQYAQDKGFDNDAIHIIGGLIADKIKEQYNSAFKQPNIPLILGYCEVPFSFEQMSLLLNDSN